MPASEERFDAVDFGKIEGGDVGADMLLDARQQPLDPIVTVVRFNKEILVLDEVDEALN